MNINTGVIFTDIHSVKSQGKKRQRAPRGSIDVRKKGYEYYDKRYGRSDADNAIGGHIEHLEGSLYNNAHHDDQHDERPFWVAQQEEAQAKWGYGAPAPGSALKLNYQRTKLLDQYSPSLSSFAEDGPADEPVYAGGGGPASATATPVKKKKFRINKPTPPVVPGPKIKPQTIREQNIVFLQQHGIDPKTGEAVAPEEEEEYKLSSGYLKGYPLKGAGNNRFNTLELAIAYYKNADPGTKAKIGGITEAKFKGSTVYELRKGKTLLPDANSFSIIL